MNFFAPVAVWGFWILLVTGWMLDELDAKATAAFVVLWLAGFAGGRFVLQGVLFRPFVAVLDIALVFVVFKGDVKLR